MKNIKILKYFSIHSYVLILSFIICIIFFLPNFTYAENNSVTFPSNDRMRYQIYIDFENYVNGQAQFTVSAEQINFDTGAYTHNTYEFADASLNPAIKLRDDVAPNHATIDGTSDRLVAYSVLSTSKGEVIYKFDLSTKSLTKLAEYNYDTWINFFPDLNIYEVQNPSSRTYTAYSLQTLKPVFPKGIYDSITTIKDSKAACYNTCKLTDYVVTKFDSNYSNQSDYIVQRNGKLIPIKLLHEQYDDNSSTYTRYLYNNMGKLVFQGYVSSDDTSAVHVYLIKDSKKKLILNTKGSIPNDRFPVFSPNGKYVAFVKEIYGEHMHVDDSTIYIYDTSTMELVKKIKPYYNLRIYLVLFDSNDIIRVKYDTSNPGKYRDIYYALFSNTVTKAEVGSFTELDQAHYDNFNYDGLYNLEAPAITVINNEYVRYSKQGSFNKNGTVYIPLNDFAKHTGATVVTKADQTEITLNDLKIFPNKSDLELLGDEKYISARKLTELGFKITYATSNSVFMISTKNS